MDATKRFLLVLAGVGLLMALSGADKVTCVPAPPEEPVCVVAADCDGLAHPLCEGAWTCEMGKCSWECGIVPQPVSCYADDDCGAGFFCEYTNDCCAPEGCLPGMACPAVCVACGVCKAIEEKPCYNDAECAPGQYCEITNDCCPIPGCPMCDACAACGQCVSKQPGCCAFDKDCGFGSVCVSGVCEKLPPDGGCWSDAQCPGGKCVGAITCPCGAMCFAASKPGVCEYPVPGACYADADCALGQVCKITNDCCAPKGCFPGMACPDVCVACGECVVPDASCTADSDCPPGMSCETVTECPPCYYNDPPCLAPCWLTGTCVPGSACASEADCNDGDACTADFCHNGDCENVLKTGCCSADEQCAPGELCSLECPPCDCPPVGDGPCFCPDCIGTCQAAGPACKKIDPFSFGICAMFLGYGFDGAKCVGVSGCGCGDSCDALFKSLEECKKACLFP